MTQGHCKDPSGHLWMRYYPGGHVIAAECHYCGAKADVATINKLDAQFQQTGRGLGLGGARLD